MIIYSLWMLREWSSVAGHEPRSSSFALVLSSGIPALSSWGFSLPAELRNREGAITENLARSLLKDNLQLPNLPAPWFIYVFLCAGAITCFVSLTGHVAAELKNSFCLSCYSVLQVVLILAQFAVIAALFFDRHWRDDIPADPTGELDKIQAFIFENLDTCKWVALGVVLLEVLGIFFAFVLRAVTVSAQRGYDSDEDYIAARSAGRQPGGNRQVNQANPAPGSAAAVEARAPRLYAWSTRMREKYGLDTSEFTSKPSESRRPLQPNQTPGPVEQQNFCTII